jgi:hypothetical protein
MASSRFAKNRFCSSMAVPRCKNAWTDLRLSPQERPQVSAGASILLLLARSGKSLRLVKNEGIPVVLLIRGVLFDEVHVEGTVLWMIFPPDRSRYWSTSCTLGQDRGWGLLDPNLLQNRLHDRGSFIKIWLHRGLCRRHCRLSICVRLLTVIPSRYATSIFFP